MAHNEPGCETRQDALSGLGVLYAQGPPVVAHWRLCRPVCGFKPPGEEDASPRRILVTYLPIEILRW